jgi:hypothetical protein
LKNEPATDRLWRVKVKSRSQRETESEKGECHNLSTRTRVI